MSVSPVLDDPFFVLPSTEMIWTGLELGWVGVLGLPLLVRAEIR